MMEMMFCNTASLGKRGMQISLQVLRTYMNLPGSADPTSAEPQLVVGGTRLFSNKLKECRFCRVKLI